MEHPKAPPERRETESRRPPRDRAPRVRPGRQVHFADFGLLSAEERGAAVAAGLRAQFMTEALDIVRVSKASLLHGLGPSSSTVARVVQANGRFSTADSERLAMLARLWSAAIEVYGEPEGARSWLTGHVASAGGIPLRLLKSHEGFERAQRATMLDFLPIGGRRLPRIHARISAQRGRVQRAKRYWSSRRLHCCRKTTCCSIRGMPIFEAFPHRTKGASRSTRACARAFVNGDANPRDSED